MASKRKVVSEIIAWLWFVPLALVVCVAATANLLGLCLCKYATLLHPAIDWLAPRAVLFTPDPPKPEPTDA